MSRPQQWTTEEGVLLLSGLLEVIQKKKTRKEVIKSVSQQLRNLAVSKGQLIDDVYRNENGITFQLASMESAYYGRTIVKPATRLFSEVVELYRQDQNEFKKILKGVLEMLTTPKTHEEAYMEWLSTKVSPMQLSELYGTYREIENFCLKTKIIHTPLFENTEYLRAKKVKEAIETNKVFRFNHKKHMSKYIAAATHFLHYCKEDSVNHYESTTKHTTNLGEVIKSEADEALEKQYPIIYKKIKAVVCSSENKKLTPSEIKLQIGTIARLSDVEYIISHASWGYPIIEENLSNDAPTSDNTVTYFSPLRCREQQNYDRIGEAIKEWSDVISISETLVKNNKFRENMLFVIAVNTGLTLEVILELKIGHFLNANKSFKQSIFIDKKKVANNSREVCGEYVINEDIKSAVFLYLQSKVDYALDDYLFVGESNNSDKNASICLQSAIRLLSNISDEINNRFVINSRSVHATYEYHFKSDSDNGLEETSKSEPIKCLSDIVKISKYLVAKKRYRDDLLFAVGFGFGLATKELTKLKFHHFLNADGSIKLEFPVFTSSLDDDKSPYYVVISDEVKKSIARYLTNTNITALDDFVFKSESNNSTGEVLSTQSINRIIKNAIIEAGININPAALTLKKTFIYHQLLMSHGDIQTKTMIRKALHHRNFKLTLAFLSSTEEEFESLNTKSSDNPQTERIDENNTIQTVSFTEAGNYSYTVPVSLSYFEAEISDIKSWTDLYVRFFEYLYEDYPHILKPGMGFSKGSGDRIELALASEQTNMFAPKPVNGTDLVIETNISASNMIDKIRFMLDLCSVDYENIIIQYRAKNSEHNTKVEPASHIITSCVADNHDVDEKIKVVLREKFARGYRIGSGLDLKKFKRYYLELNGSEPVETDDTIVTMIRKCCIMHDDKLFFPGTMLSESIKEKLFAHIEDEFSQGKKALYYEALFRLFSEDFLDFYIYDSEMLKSYLAYCNNGKYHITSSYISKERGIATNPYDEVKEYLVNAGLPIDSETICDVLSHIPRKKVMQILGMNSEFIYNGQNQYFHVSVVTLSQEETENIASLITTLVEDKQFISGNELLSAIKSKYPYIIDNNQNFSVLGMRDTIKYRLQDDFSFAGNVISEKGKKVTMWDVFADFAKSKESFDISELVTLAEEMNSSIYFDAVYENALRISQAKFVSKENAQFQINETDMAIDRFCSKNYIPIAAITEFGSFPDAGFQWNPYLLAHYVHSYSKGYILLTAGFNRNTSVGAIVNRALGVENFDDFLAIALAEGNCALKKDDALNFLVNQGYLARRSYSNIERVLIQANAKRNMKGSD